MFVACKIDSTYLCWISYLHHKPIQKMASLTLDEDKYFEWHETLVSQHDARKFVVYAYVLYAELLEMDWTDTLTDNFLYKCYANTLSITVAIIQHSVEYVNRNGDDELKITAVRALSSLHKMRVKLAGYLLERVNDSAFADRISACMNRAATEEEKKTVVEMHRCRLHIQSPEFSSSEYKFETLDNDPRDRFDLLHVSVVSNYNNEDKFIKNVETCMRSPLIGYVR